MKNHKLNVSSWSTTDHRPSLVGTRRKVTFARRVRVPYVCRLTSSLVRRAVEGRGRPGGVEQAGFQWATSVYSRRVAGGPGPRGVAGFGPLSGRRHGQLYFHQYWCTQLGQLGSTPYIVSSCWKCIRPPASGCVYIAARVKRIGSQLEERFFRAAQAVRLRWSARSWTCSGRPPARWNRILRYPKLCTQITVHSFKL